VLSWVLHRCRAAPARLAAWCIGRAPPRATRDPKRSGARNVPDARPVSYLRCRKTVNTAVTEDDSILSQQSRPAGRRNHRQLAPHGLIDINTGML